MPKEPSTATSMKTFLTIWVGQLLSQMGSRLTAFALSVWVFKQTESVTQFGFVILAVVLPGVLVAPWAGVLVDRWDRRWAMLLSDTGSGIVSLALAFLYFTDRLEVWNIAVAMIFGSIFTAFQTPAYGASISLLVPEEQYTRANGMVQAAQASAGVFAPLIAGLLLPIIEVSGVILIDFVTYLVALVTLLIVRIPRPEVSQEHAEASGSALREAALGWRFISGNSGLLGLLLFFTAINMFSAAANVLMPPMVLTFASVTTTGIISTVFGVGMLLGSIFISAWGGPKRRVLGVIAFGIINGLALVVVGLRPNALVIGVGVFLLAFTDPALNACSQAIWQRKTPPHLQGRVFALRMMMAQAAMPIGLLLAGPLADRVFEPMMASGGALAPTLGPLIGVGAGRGMALMTIIMGLCSAVAAALVFVNPKIRAVEDEPRSEELPQLHSEAADYVSPQS